MRSAPDQLGSLLKAKCIGADLGIYFVSKNICVAVWTWMDMMAGCCHWLTATNTSPWKFISWSILFFYTFVFWVWFMVLVWKFSCCGMFLLPFLAYIIRVFCISSVKLFILSRILIILGISTFSPLYWEVQAAG